MYRDAKKFVSFKKTISELGSDYSHIPMFSLQSISKGYYGELGLAQENITPGGTKLLHSMSIR